MVAHVDEHAIADRRLELEERKKKKGLMLLFYRVTEVRWLASSILGQQPPDDPSLHPLRDRRPHLDTPSAHVHALRTTDFLFRVVKEVTG